MIDLDNNEAILFRLLASFFGRDKVIPQMSILAVCGGELPAGLSEPSKDSNSNQVSLCAEELQALKISAKKMKCLFTVVNDNDLPRLVVELGVDAKGSIDLAELDKQEKVRPILGAASIPYIILSKNELSFVCDPTAPENWFHLLQSKFEEASAKLAA